MDDDLLKAFGLFALWYGVFSTFVSVKNGQPLVEWINAGRRNLIWYALALWSFSGSQLWLSALQHHCTLWDLFILICTHEDAPRKATMAVAVALFGLSLVGLQVWCKWFLPRDPRSFAANCAYPKREYRRCLRHYVRWKKGRLAYALLFAVRGKEFQVIAEVAADRDIRRGLERLDLVPQSATPEALQALMKKQKQTWEELGRELVRKWTEYCHWVTPARQGECRSLCLHVASGAIFLERLSASTDHGVFLFATSLNAHEVDAMTAAKQFSLLVQAIDYIRRGVVRG